ncbi:hypothetical protein [Sigmofec virus UA08Rod_4258]|uniref:Uncharacterized protein n=1 Tax=Sigmofec virus UA08Rod_4258 TaxID=2929397 RepID=A0A976R831_9VIRU|nr:hypothetical protein [Sigmofec virus UA08Rod_4258]
MNQFFIVTAQGSPVKPLPPFRGILLSSDDVTFAHEALVKFGYSAVIFEPVPDALDAIDAMLQSASSQSAD